MQHAIARKVGEGYDRSEQDIPLDINYGTLLRWLTGRGMLPKDWHKRVQALRAGMTEAAKQLPSGLLQSLPGGSDAPLDYFRAVQVRDALAATSEKTLFGGLTGAAGAWDKIVKAYEKDALFLGEAAQTLVQNTDYEIPFLKRQAAKSDQQIEDGERRHTEFTRAAAAAATAYEQECSKFGIAGRSVRSELQALRRQLPPLFEAAVAALRQPPVQQAADYYAAFIEFAHGREAAVAGGRLLPTLAEVVAGATAPSADSAQHGEEPSRSVSVNNLQVDWNVVETGRASGSSSCNDWSLVTGGDGIDVGPVGTDADAADAGCPPLLPAGGINWDLDLDAAGAAAEQGGAAGGEAAVAAAAGEAEPAVIDISWDIDVSAQAPAAEGGDASGAMAVGGGIDWDIQLTDAAAETAAGAGIDIDWNVGMEAAADSGAGADAAVAGDAVNNAGSDAAVQRLCADGEYRSLLLDDLQELRAFLRRRRQELGSSGATALLASSDAALARHEDAGALAAMLEAVDGALGQLTAPQLSQLLLIASSGSYVERLAAGLQRKGGQERKLLAAAAEALAKAQQAKCALREAQPRIAAVVERTRAIKAAVEAKVGSLMNGRRVNVLGDINAMLR